MIDARLWTRPSADEIRDVIHGLRDGRTVRDTASEIGARLGTSRRAVFYWMQAVPPPGREISYCEWFVLKELTRNRGSRTMYKTILTASALLIALVGPVYAAPVEQGLQGGAAQAGCSSCTNDTQSGSEDHQDAEGETQSYPSCTTTCGGTSSKDTSEGAVEGSTEDPPAQVGTEPGID